MQRATINVSIISLSNMSRKKNTVGRKVALTLAMLAGLLVGAVGWYLTTVNIPVLQPAGPIAAGQMQMLVQAFLLMLIVVIPVFVLAFSFAWRYREGNKKATYKPNWDSNNWFEAVWWIVPSVLIGFIAVMTWHGTFKYDPYKPLASSEETLTVQVISLDWRWLFIYPEQRVASVNELYIPTNTAVRFEMTADAPMNSFWIPQLGGQMYVMPGMGTILHLQADRTGEFYGSGANITGKGFADMNFVASAVTQKQFETWVAGARQQVPLTMDRYNQLAQPTVNDDIILFSNPANDLYATIIHKYMNMGSNAHDGHEMHASQEGDE